MAKQFKELPYEENYVYEPRKYPTQRDSLYFILKLNWWHVIGGYLRRIFNFRNEKYLKRMRRI